MNWKSLSASLMVAGLVTVGATGLQAQPATVGIKHLNLVSEHAVARTNPDIRLIGILGHGGGHHGHHGHHHGHHYGHHYGHRLTTDGAGTLPAPNVVR